MSDCFIGELPRYLIYNNIYFSMRLPDNSEDAGSVPCLLIYITADFLSKWRVEGENKYDYSGHFRLRFDFEF
jgi:hypothetical protein